MRFGITLMLFYSLGVSVSAEQLLQVGDEVTVSGVRVKCEAPKRRSCACSRFAGGWSVQAVGPKSFRVESSGHKNYRKCEHALVLITECMI